MQHNFWKTQPVPSGVQFGQVPDKNALWITPPEAAVVTDNGPVVNFQVQEIKKTPFDLPPGYEWFEFDINNEAEAKPVYDFLGTHYSVDPDNILRLTYSFEMLRWALCPPNFKKEWHIGVKFTKTGAIVGTITGVPSTLSVYGQTVVLVEINFLCIHPQYRNKSLAPILIKEISRRVGLNEIWHAVYTSALKLPHAVSEVCYFHRPLNVKKLVQSGFLAQHPKLTMKGMMKLYELPASVVQTKGLRPLQAVDVAAACKLLNTRQSALPVSTTFSEDEFRYKFLPPQGNNIVYSFVVVDDEKGLTDFISFYSLPSTLLQNNKEVKTAYLYYHTITTATLLCDALVLAVQLGFDVFNAMNVMGNSELLNALKFRSGNGVLRYYLYNWKCPQTKSDDIGLILV